MDKRNKIDLYLKKSERTSEETAREEAYYALGEYLANPPKHIVFLFLYQSVKKHH